MALSDFITGFTSISFFFLVIGIILMVIEVFTPGFGIFGIGGLIALLLAIIYHEGTLATRLWMAVIMFAVIGILLLLILRSATHGAISKSELILNEKIEANASYISSEDLQYFVGRVGVSTTTLRPSGVADFDGVRLDVVTEGDFIAQNEQIRIQEIVGRRIVVERAAVEVLEEAHID